MTDIIPIENLLERSQSYQKIYKNALPYPHIVLDNFFPEEMVNEVLSEFPSASSNWSVNWNLKDEIKSLSKGEEMFGEKTKMLSRYLNSEPFLFFLEKLTGIKNLIPDPHFSGGGFHQIKRGGYLKIHADFNKHKETNLDRRLNVLIYLNKNWKEEYGGHFELWDKEMTGAVKKILPVFNRMVVFSTTTFSFHGHPDPLNCPEGETRKSLAFYYYTNGRPEEEVVPGMELHDTLFQKRKNEKYDNAFKKEIFKERIKYFIPPFLVDLLRKIMR